MGKHALSYLRVAGDQSSGSTPHVGDFTPCTIRRGPVGKLVPTSSPSIQKAISIETFRFPVSARDPASAGCGSGEMMPAGRKRGYFRGTDPCLTRPRSSARGVASVRPRQRRHGACRVSLFVAAGGERPGQTLGESVYIEQAVGRSRSRPLQKTPISLVRRESAGPVYSARLTPAHHSRTLTAAASDIRYCDVGSACVRAGPPSSKTLPIALPPSCR